MNDSATSIPITVRLKSATAAARDGEFDDAIVDLKQILADTPEHEVALGMLAAVYLQIGMHDKAVEHFTRLLEVSPQNPLARFQLGMAHLTGGEADKALDTWQAMLELDDDFMAHFHSGLALLQLGRSAEAKPMFEGAQRNMPASHPLHPQLVEILSSLPQK